MIVRKAPYLAMTPADLYGFCMVIIAVITLVKDFYDRRR